VTGPAWRAALSTQAALSQASWVGVRLMVGYRALELGGDPLLLARGELDAAGEIRRRFVAGRAAHDVTTPQAIAAARAAAQAAGVAHMGAHALGAAAYAAKAAGLSRPDQVDAVRDEIRWQLEQLSPLARTALRQLPLLGQDTAGPLGPGLLSRGVLATNIRAIQAGLA